jgi:hypothetical protein
VLGDFGMLKENKEQGRIQFLLTENSVRHIDTIKEMEALKHQYQIRCSHYKLEFTFRAKLISCAICQKNWHLSTDEIDSNKNKEIYLADKES